MFSDFSVLSISVRKFKLRSIKRVERKKDSNGTRYLLELELKRIRSEQIVLLSEYIYSFKGKWI